MTHPPDTYTVDTNIWVRYLTQDNLKQFNQAKDYFSKAQKGDLKLRLEPVVVAETCFVLESFYKQDRNTISSAWQTILGQKWLQVPQRKQLQVLWPHYLSGLHWVDSYLLAWSEINQGSILTFDKQLLKTSSLSTPPQV